MLLDWAAQPPPLLTAAGKDPVSLDVRNLKPAAGVFLRLILVLCQDHWKPSPTVDSRLSFKLSDAADAIQGQSVSDGQPRPPTAESAHQGGRDSSKYSLHDDEEQGQEDFSRAASPPPQYPASEASAYTRPPPFDSLYAASDQDLDEEDILRRPSSSRDLSEHSALHLREAQASSSSAAPAPAYVPIASGPSKPVQPASPHDQAPPDQSKQAKSEAKEAKDAKEDDAEPPPAYSEGDIPLQSFTYLMAAAGGASSIITQVQQGGPPINTIGGGLHGGRPRISPNHG